MGCVKMMKLKPFGSDLISWIRIRTKISNCFWFAEAALTAAPIGRASIGRTTFWHSAVALFFLAGLTTTAYAQIDNVDAAKEEARAQENAPKPLTTLPPTSRNKIDGGTLSVSDLKSQMRMVTPGWLRTYATVAIPPDMLLAIPDYYETALEADMRATIEQGLMERDIEIIDDPDQSSFRLTYSAEVREPDSTRPRQSRLRLSSDAADNSISWSPRMATPANGVRPGISLGTMPEYAPRGPVLRASIIVLDGDERIWSGYAEATLGEYQRTELTRILARALLRHWGENAELDSMHFSSSPGVGLTLGDENGAGQP